MMSRYNFGPGQFCDALLSAQLVLAQMQAGKADAERQKLERAKEALLEWASEARPLGVLEGLISSVAEHLAIPEQGLTMEDIEGVLFGTAKSLEDMQFLSRGDQVSPEEYEKMFKVLGVLWNHMFSHTKRHGSRSRGLCSAI